MLCVSYCLMRLFIKFYRHAWDCTDEIQSTNIWKARKMPVIASYTHPLSSLCSSLAGNKTRLQVHTHTHKDVQQRSARGLEKSRGWYERYTHSLSISVQLLHPHVLLLLLLSLLNSRWVWLGQRKPQGGRDERGVDPRDVTQVLELLLKFNSSLITVILLQ